MKVLQTAIPGVLLIEPEIFADARGWLMESWNAAAFRQAGLPVDFVQDNHSRSARGVLRGLHYQMRWPQGKLVRAVAGRIFDVAVDLRRSSPNFGAWTGAELSAENKRMLWIPPGFAHGFLSLEGGSECVYKCTAFYAPEEERALLWSDPCIGINWPLEQAGAPLLSARDASAPLLADADTYE
jgi:dTDP-4-dehydrorhamnose 3,5-epimerase